MNIVLTGFMASGKTEISKVIASISNYKLIDTDDMITKAVGMSINEFFDKFGESEFRNIEHNIVCEAAKLDGYIIATGGGVPLNKDNMDQLRKNGIIINLAPDFCVIEERLEAARATRPLLKEQDIESIQQRFNERIPFYNNCDFKIHVINGRTPKSYAMEILDICERKR